MRVLVAHGFEDGHACVDATRIALEARGHAVTELGLVAAGFSEFMSERERRAYHEADNLVTREQRESADLLRSHDALVVCTPVRAGTVSPTVKSWFERVFIPGISFTFTEAGRITAALTNIRRLGMVVVTSSDDPSIHRRAGSTRSIARAVRLNCARTCRTTYVDLGPGADIPARIQRAFRRW